MTKLKIKKDDKVVVLAGRDKGKSGVVLQAFPKENRVLVQGINMIKRHQKQTAENQGGIVSREAKINVSNLAIADPKDGKPSRVGYKLQKDGTKQRIAKRSGEVIDG